MDPEKLTGISYLIDQLNRDVLDNMVKRNMGSSVTVVAKRARRESVDRMVNGWLAKGFSPDMIMSAITNNLAGLKRGMSPFQPHESELPQFNPSNRSEIPTMDERHLKQRQGAILSGGKPTFRL